MSIYLFFATNLKSARVFKDLTQAQLAEKCGLSNGYLGDLERGKKSPSLDVIEKLAENLDVEPYEFLIDPKKRCSIYAKNKYICDLQKDMSEKINEAVSLYKKRE